MTTPASALRSSAGRRGPLDPRHVLGVPVLPPAAATTGANRARDALRRVWSTMAPPPVRILEGIFGLLDHRVLVALCEVDAPDHLDRRMTVSELAVRTGADPDALERLVRYASTRGWVAIDRRGRVKPTRVTEFLRRDHPGGWRAWVEFAGGDDVVSAVGELDPRPGGRDPFASANGAAFFEWMADHPGRHDVFDRAMSAGARVHALGLDQVLAWDDVTTVCDVGGGTGTLLAGLLDLQPHLEGTLLEIPEVVERAVDHARMRVVAGDAFVEVPSGADRYLLVNVIHDWGDDDAVRILRSVAVAAPPGAEIVVVDAERSPMPHDPISAATDVLMAALTPGGTERDTDAMRALGRTVDLVHLATHALPSGDRAHVFGASADSRATLEP